jgi:uncharacterized protein (DUF2062 family)
LKTSRRIRYYYLRLTRLKGEPHELAMGIAVGVFAGMLPVVPFQTALAVVLAFPFKGSKITAALGTWISNPLNWYFLYYYCYQIGAFLLNIHGEDSAFAAIMAAIRSGQDAMVVSGKIAGAGGVIIAAFLLGGLMMALVAAPIFYSLSLVFFKKVRTWRESRKERKRWHAVDP